MGQFMLAGCIPMGAVFLESYVTSPWHVMVRFGKWDDIISEPLRTDKAVFPNGMVVQHYARGVAYASKGLVPEAEAELAKFLEARQDVEGPVPMSARVQHNVHVTKQHDIQEKILVGEIEYRKAFLAKKDGQQADFEKAWVPLYEAIDLSLNLPYNEPWGQMQPVRHILGALKLEQGQVDEAEEIYRADIKPSTTKSRPNSRLLLHALMKYPRSPACVHNRWLLDVVERKPKRHVKHGHGRMLILLYLLSLPVASLLTSE